MKLEISSVLRQFVDFSKNFHLYTVCTCYIMCTFYTVYKLLCMLFSICSSAVATYATLMTLCLILYHIHSCCNDPVSTQRSSKFYMNPV